MADALINGKAIEISGGEYVNSGECKVDFLCKECDHVWESKCNQGRLASCLNCESGLIFLLCSDGSEKKFIEDDSCCPKKGKQQEHQ